MRDSTIEFKVKVFISSKCGGRYTIVRKALKELLLETNMTEVYVFEDASGSSQNLISSYISRLEDSDLCVFLIDNKDGISDPVLAEHQRAAVLNKKMIYIFCDEDEKRPTQMQNEAKGKYVVVHEFADIIRKAYQSIFQDVIDVYRAYCRDQLVQKNDSNELDKIIQAVDTYIIDKKIFKGFDLTKSNLLKTIYSFQKEVTNVSKLDNLCSQFISIIIGKSSAKEFEFDLLKNSVSSTQEKFMGKFMEYRFNAIKAYFADNLMECLEKLELAYNEGKENKNIPNWLVNDVAIDMRNVEILINETQSIYSLDIRGQKLLDENVESVFYPLIDRIDFDIRNDLLKKCISFNNDSPFSITLGSDDSIFKFVATNFCIAVIYGSLTHILMTRVRLINIFSTLCIQYSNHKFYLELMKYLIMERKGDEIDKIIRIYNQSIDIVNANDVEMLLNGVRVIPIFHQRVISLCLLFKYFGYYFSDEQYKAETDVLLGYVSTWIADPDKIFKLASYLFDFLESNLYRINNEKIIILILNIFKYELKRWYDESLKIISKIDYKHVTRETQMDVLQQVIAIIEDNAMRDNCNYLTKAIIYIRKSNLIDMAILDKKVKEYMPYFYENEFSLEVLCDKDQYMYIQDFIDDIHKRNEEQGKNGTFHGYANNPYWTIRNIIEYGNLSLDWNEIKKVLSVNEETLLSSNQTIKDKINAIRLTLYLRNKFSVFTEWNELICRWCNQSELMLCGFDNSFIEKDTMALLKLNFSLLKISFDKCDPNEFMVAFFENGQMGEYESIEVLISIETLLFERNYNILSANILAVLMQYVALMSFHKEREIKFLAVKCLIHLTHSPYKQVALRQLSKIMDIGTSDVKTLILSRVKRIHDDNAVVKYIIQKGKNDNNYLIRKIACANED